MSTITTAAPTSGDRARQVGVTAAEVFCVVGTLVGTGVLGTEVSRSSDGALAADATLLAPAGPAFSIWSVIYVGLAAYAVWQWLPGRATDPRLRATGWLAAASMVLNAGWLLVTQQGWVWLSVGVILALIAVLVELVRRLARHPVESGAARVVEDGTFGLYLGWVSVAAGANLAAALTSSEVSAGRGLQVLGAAAVIAVVAGLHLWLVREVGPRLAVAAAAAWGLAWVAVGRLGDEPQSATTAAVAVVAAVAIVAAVLSARRLGVVRAGAGR